MYYFSKISAELCNSKNSLEDFKDQLEVAQRENKKLSLEYECVLGQIVESERRLKQIEQVKRRYTFQFKLHFLLHYI